MPLVTFFLCAVMHIAIVVINNYYQYIPVSNAVEEG